MSRADPQGAHTAEERLANDPRSELWGEHRARYRFAARFIARGGGLTVLDVACGSGFGLRMLQQVGAIPLGVDYDAQTLRDICATWTVPAHRPRRDSAEPADRSPPRLVRADATRLPLRTASIDVAVSFETLEHVADARALVVELRRVLKPGGRLVLSTPNRAFGPPEVHTANKFHIHEFTADELRDLLCESFAEVQLYAQRPSSYYRYVPFLMIAPSYAPSALVWKTLVRLPFGVKNQLALALSKHPFYPSEDDYTFDAGATESSHVLVAVAR